MNQLLGNQNPYLMNQLLGNIYIYIYIYPCLGVPRQLEDLGEAHGRHLHRPDASLSRRRRREGLRSLQAATIIYSNSNSNNNTNNNNTNNNNNTYSDYYYYYYLFSLPAGCSTERPATPSPSRGRRMPGARRAASQEACRSSRSSPVVPRSSAVVPWSSTVFHRSAPWPCRRSQAAAA